MDNTQIKLLHTWEVTLDRQVDETTTEQRDGQSVTVTRKVSKPVATKMALKNPTRRELKQAELFYGKRYNWYFNQGFTTRSILQNQHFNVTGGVLNEKQKARLEELRARAVDLDKELTAAKDAVPAIKDPLEKELVTIRNEFLSLHSSNEAAFTQTADKRAERDLTDWFAYHLIVIERNGQWATYFEGDGFDAKEEFMWKLEESADPFYAKAMEEIATVIQLFSLGVDTPEKFKRATEELKKSDTAAAAPATAPVVVADPQP